MTCSRPRRWRSPALNTTKVRPGHPRGAGGEARHHRAVRGRTERRRRSGCRNGQNSPRRTGGFWASGRGSVCPAAGGRAPSGGPSQKPRLSPVTAARTVITITQMMERWELGLGGEEARRQDRRLPRHRQPGVFRQDGREENRVAVAAQPIGQRPGSARQTLRTLSVGVGNGALLLQLARRASDGSRAAPRCASGR